MGFHLECDNQGKFCLPEGIVVSKEYGEAIVKYTNILYPFFEKAQGTNEFDFLLTLWRLRGESDTGWDPYETSIRTIRGTLELANANVNNFELQINLSLWIYCHIVEASEPYEIITNLINIGEGGRFNRCCYPPKLISGNREKILYPGDKIDRIKRLAYKNNTQGLDIMYNEVYDRDIRNAVFHSDYAIDKKGFRIMRPAKSISWGDIKKLIERGLAYFESVTNLYYSFIASYSEPVTIPAPDGFSPDTDAKLRIIVREGHGAVGFRTEATQKQIAQGKIIAKGGRYFADELKLLEENPSIDILPQRK